MLSHLVPCGEHLGLQPFPASIPRWPSSSHISLSKQRHGLQHESVTLRTSSPLLSKVFDHSTPQTTWALMDVRHRRGPVVDEVIDFGTLDQLGSWTIKISNHLRKRPASPRCPFPVNQLVLQQKCQHKRKVQNYLSQL